MPDSPAFTPRLTVDAAWAAELLGRLCAAPLGAREGAGETQIDASFTAGDALAAAGLRYALGHPLGEVRAALERALGALVRLFELRGTTAAFAAEQVTLSVRGAELERRSLGGGGEVDASLTSSRTGLLAMQLALGIGRPDRALHLAGLIGDPIGASYLGPDSVVCTVHEQCIAYALRALLRGDRRAAADELLRMQGNAEARVALQSTLLYAVISHKPDFFLERLELLLDAHRARSTAEPRNPELYIAVPALGLAALALAESLVRRDQLPRDALLPIALL